MPSWGQNISTDVNHLINDQEREERTCEGTWTGEYWNVNLTGNISSPLPGRYSFHSPPLSKLSLVLTKHSQLSLPEKHQDQNKMSRPESRPMWAAEGDRWLRGLWRIILRCNLWSKERPICRVCCSGAASWSLQVFYLNYIRVTLSHCILSELYPGHIVR